MADAVFKTGFVRSLFTIISCTHTSPEIIIPEEIDGHSIEAIGADAFLNDRLLTQICFPDTLRRIDDRAFQGCSSLRSIVLPPKVTYLGAFAFADCDSMTSVFVPGSVPVIGYCCFSICTALQSVSLSEGLKVISNHAFEECRSLRDLWLPRSLTAIGNGAFYNCLQLDFPDLPDSILSIGHSAFYRSGASVPEFDTVTLPESVELLGAKPFRCRRLIINGKPEIDALSPGIRVIRALQMLPEVFRDLGALPAACAGFSELFFEGSCIADDIRESYISTMRDDSEFLYPAAVEAPSLLRFMMRYKLIPREDIQILIDLCMGNPPIVAELLQYSAIINDPATGSDMLAL